MKIFLWSMPRCQSTALMYAFAQRSDTAVVDEPLYAHFLRMHPDAARQGTERADTMAAQDSDGDAVVQKVMLADPPAGKRVVFHKNITKFARGLDRGAFAARDDVVPVFLIREPEAIMKSFAHGAQIDDPDKLFDEAGLADALELIALERQRGRDPIVLDAQSLSLAPEATLSLLCERLGLPFEPTMLSWPKGGRPEDGPWAVHWYKHLHESTGFEARSPPTTSLEDALARVGAQYAVYERAWEIYLSLVPLCLRPASRRTHAMAKDELPTDETRHGLAPEDPAELARFLPDPRNANIKIWLGDRLVPRAEAKISVFDGLAQNGDGVWEGLRVYGGRVFCLDEHIDRMFRSAKALAYRGVPTAAFIKNAIKETLVANGMLDGAHIRLTLSRGSKVTSGMSPALQKFGCTLIVLAEHKVPVYSDTLTLITSCVRRNGPNQLDSKIHHACMLNNILAKMDANLRGADDAVMLDESGYVAETNGTNMFCVVRGTLLTPHGDYCLPGITRRLIIQLAGLLEIPIEVRRVSLSEFHSADEVFTTGTMGELSPVLEIDGRVIGDGAVGPITKRLQRVHGRIARVCGEAILDDTN